VLYELDLKRVLGFNLQLVGILLLIFFILFVTYQLKRGLMGYLYKNHEKNTIDCLVESYQFYTLSAQTTPEKTPEKNNQLNEVTIIKTKKSDRAKADRTI
jgi:hypothetical protein